MSIEQRPGEDECLDVIWQEIASWCRGEISLDDMVERVCAFVNGDPDPYINRKEQAYENHED